MKKSILVSGLVIASLLLNACGSNNDQKQGKESNSDDVSIKVNTGDYVAVTDFGDKNEQTYLKLNLTVHNKYKEKLHLSERDFKLYDQNDEEIESVDISSVDEDAVKDIYGNISSQKKKTGDVAFPVNSDEKYELHFAPDIYYEDGKEPEDLVVNIDPSKYKNETENAKNALTAYIDNVFLSKENDDVKKILVNDVIKDSQKYDEAIADSLKEAFDDHKPTLKTEKVFIEKFRTGIQKKIEPNYLIEYADSNTAKIKVTFNQLDTSDMYDQAQKVGKQFAKKNEGKYDYNEMDKAEKDVLNYTFSRIDQIILNTDLDSYEKEMSIILTSSDGKWKVNTTEDDMNSQYDDLFDAFVLEYY